MLCYDQSVPDFGPMPLVPDFDRHAVSSGLRSNAASSRLRSDAGDKIPVSSGLRSDAVSELRSNAVGKAQYVIYMYFMVCGSLGELTKLRGYSFSFGFRGHQNSNPLVEMEPSRLNLDILNNKTNKFYDVDENISKEDEVIEDACLDFEPTYPLLDKWTHNHPKEHVLGDPQAGVLTRTQMRAKNEVFNVHQE
ncbi:unnamed protein product [Lactuca saligna]|uniref:Uncharacterized protein n=1 Tax=Lactuca saligna TaxID=75948 RepID=A0AA35YDB5_LACSI|nr:unnamed protein product [Lactuca saligna]